MRTDLWYNAWKGMVAVARGVAVLGSTGSIGTQTLEVIERLADRFYVVALAAGRNVDRLIEQVRRVRPRLVSVADQQAATRLKSEIPSDVRVLSGAEGLLEAAAVPEAEIVVMAVVGARGVRPTLAALKAGKRVALANKETLVTAGAVVSRMVRDGLGSIIPVDSEHSAIFQCLRGEEPKALRRLVLTASGGPFRTASVEEMAKATVRDALKHPTWNMGGKITVDSATMMNKGLEVLEAHWLFDVAYDQIEVLVHPQSIVHSMVEFVDGSTIAQLGAPDMRAPIQYALTFPERAAATWERMALDKVGSLTFEAADFTRFPCLELAYRAGRVGGTAPAALNAANEVAVEAFLSGNAGFMDIARCVEHVLDRHTSRDVDDIDAVLEADRWAREKARAYLDA